MTQLDRIIIDLTALRDEATSGHVPDPDALRLAATRLHCAAELIEKELAE